MPHKHFIARLTSNYYYDDVYIRENKTLYKSCLLAFPSASCYLSHNNGALTKHKLSLQLHKKKYFAIYLPHENHVTIC